MVEDKIIDQSQLAEDVANQIKYDFYDFFLVKPLDPIKVKKEFSKPVAKGEPTKDAAGVEAQDFDEVETEVKEVDSDYRRGVVIKRPLFYENALKKEDFGVAEVKVGDIILFRDRAGMPFDLIKDSRMLRQFDIVGIVAQ